MDGRFTSLNRVGQQTLGYSQEEAAQTDMWRVVVPEYWEVLKQDRARMMGGATQLTSEIEVVAKDGRRVRLEVKPRLIRRGDKPVGMQVVARDITGRAIAEMELRQAQKLESVGRLASGIAHEINTPIQFVGDNTRFLGDSFVSLKKLIDKFGELAAAAASGTLSPDLLSDVKRLEEESDCAYILEEIPQAIKQTLEGVERVATIVRAMKEFAQPESKEMAPVDLNKALRSTVTVARNEWKYVADVNTELADLPPCGLQCRRSESGLPELAGECGSCYRRCGWQWRQRPHHHSHGRGKRQRSHQRFRYRLRHSRGCSHQDLRSIFHHKRGGARNRAGPGHCPLRHC
jgi:PAS domain S-box-containing protein